jgi:glycosyltransferase involved in cell wall biosynthesis
MPNLPRISIVTPSFNSIHTIRETIESVRSQDYSNWEHLVMDGGSQDGTLDILKECPHLIWSSEKDDGHYYAMNKGILRASGEVVNILNSDDCFRPGALRMVGEAFRDHPEWDALFGDVVYVDGAGKEIYRRREAGYDFNVLRYGLCYMSHQALFVRKAAYERIGLYRAQEFLNCCDYEFMLRLGQRGCRVGHVASLVVNFRFHEHGQAADWRVSHNEKRESAIVAREYGKPDGWQGQVYRTIYRLKRQAQKILHHGSCDLVPGTWSLRRHMKKKTSFASNIDVSKLQPKN